MLTASHRFEMLVTSLRKKLKLQPHESLFCYIGNVFSPALDETVENLWRVSLLRMRGGRYRGNGADGVQCFKQGPKDELYVQYAMSPAFG